MAPGNLPSLDPKDGHRLLVVTPGEDWEALQGDGRFQALARVIECEWVPLRFAPDGFLALALAEKARLRATTLGVLVQPSDIHDLTEEEITRLARRFSVRRSNLLYSLKLLMLSGGHALAAERTWAARARAVFLVPEMILSDGAVAALARRARDGQKLVLAVTLRFDQEACLNALARDGLLGGGAITLAPRRLMDLVLDHLHPETIGFDWESPAFADTPCGLLLRVPGERGFLFHALMWMPFLMDFSALEQHDPTPLRAGTIDGPYCGINIPDPADHHLVTDSDEILAVTLTPAQVHYDRTGLRWWKRPGRLAERVRLARLRVRGTFGPNADAIRRRQFARSLFFHAGAGAVDPQTEARIARLAAAALRPPTLGDRLWDRLGDFDPTALSERLKHIDGEEMRHQIGRLRTLAWHGVTWLPRRLPPRWRREIRRCLGRGR